MCLLGYRYMEGYRRYRLQAYSNTGNHKYSRYFEGQRTTEKGGNYIISQRNWVFISNSNSYIFATFEILNLDYLQTNKIKFIVWNTQGEISKVYDIGLERYIEIRKSQFEAKTQCLSKQESTHNSYILITY